MGGLEGYYRMIWIKLWGLLRPFLAGREWSWKGCERMRVVEGRRVRGREGYLDICIARFSFRFMILA
jgi:hypothetical protein